MKLDALVASASDQDASDLHLESGLPPALRIRGALRIAGEAIPASALLAMAQEVIGQEQWPRFLDQRSFDLSRTLRGIRCRINVLQTSRGVGMAIRLLSSFEATIEKLNLHPDLKRLVTHHHGFILVSGPTGSGKSSTLAALIQEINLTEARHVVTIESPIEYSFRPKLAYIRQREVGRDTPSFDQALLDALREDPDVLMVGEMRDPETMRLTLNASETGHLVLSTVHSSTCVEALQRIVSAFPAETQSSVRAQLADSLLAVICQRLRFRPDLRIRVPECEILMQTMAVKNFIRTGEFFKISSALEIGAESGMWTFQRYQTWLEKKKTWFFPAPEDMPEGQPVEAVVSPPKIVTLPSKPGTPEGPETTGPAPHFPRSPLPTASGADPEPPVVGNGKAGGVVEIEPVEGGLDELLKRLK